jgi:hypothetical protein
MVHTQPPNLKSCKSCRTTSSNNHPFISCTLLTMHQLSFTTSGPLNADRNREKVRRLLLRPESKPCNIPTMPTLHLSPLLEQCIPLKIPPEPHHFQNVPKRRTPSTPPTLPSPTSTPTYLPTPSTTPP